jgi:chaperonin GroES
MAAYGKASKSKRSKKGDGETRVSGKVALNKLIAWADLPNVAEEIDEDDLNNLGSRVVNEYNLDEASRTDWKTKAEKALDRAKLKSVPKNYPFDKASNVKNPILASAALQFAARAYPAIVDGQRIVKGQVVGDDAGVPVKGPDGNPVLDEATGEPQWQSPPGAKRSKAERISKHMSHQLINEMPEWEEDTDVLLGQVPIVGCAFRKVFYDPVLGRNRSEMVPALDFVVNQRTRSLETVPRMTQVFELYPHEIEDRQAEGLYLDCDLGIAMGNDGDDDAPHEFLEQHRYCDLDEDGSREPWIVTVHKDTGKVVRIVANFDPAELRLKDDGKLGRIPRYNMFVKYPFFRDPEGGFYDLGFGELLEPLSEVIDSTVNQMLDAGHLQNAGGGFIGSGLRLKKNQMRFAPGQYHVVDAQGSKVREAIVNMEHPGPSNVLFQLLGMMVEWSKEIANVKDILSGDQPRNQPATTTLAMIEQGMKVYTSIYKRLYRALKKEYGLLFALNAKHLPEEQYLTVLDSPMAIAREDYEVGSMDVMPAADPNSVTDMQKMQRAQVYLEVGTNPEAQKAGVDMRECLLRFFDALGAEDIEKLMPPKPAQPSPPEKLQMADAMAKVEEQEGKAMKAKAEGTIATDQAERVTRARDAEEFQKNLHGQLQAIMGGQAPEMPQPKQPRPNAANAAVNGNGRAQPVA